MSKLDFGPRGWYWSLDPKIGAEVMELVCEVAEERQIPVLFSVHDLSIARNYSHRIIGLQQGEKVFDEQTGALDGKSIEHIYGFAPNGSPISAAQ